MSPCAVQPISPFAHKALTARGEADSKRREIKKGWKEQFTASYTEDSLLFTRTNKARGLFVERRRV